MRVGPGSGAPAELLACAAELFCGEQGIHRSGAESFQIESDELETEAFEDGRELGRHGWIQRAIHFVPGDLNADNLAVMPHAKLPEAEGSDGIFAAFDHIERFARNRTAILDARRETCRSRLVPDAKPGLLRQFTDLLFREAGF